MSARKDILKVLLPFGLVIGGILAFGALVATKPKPGEKPRNETGVLVEVTSVAAVERPAVVVAQGQLSAAQFVELQPEVTGRVVWQSSELVPGGRFTKGETILRIDSRDYRLAVEQQLSSVERARLELEIERGRKKVAEKEWELMGNGEQGTGKGLALREPQLKNATVAVDAAESGLRRAKLGLERTAIRAPFNAIVQDETVDPGKLITPASRLGTLVGTDAFWVQVSIPADALAWIEVPNGTTGGSVATVWQELGGQRNERAGRVIRLFGDLDPVGRMARVLVQIDDPYSLRSEESGLPMLLNSYVNVEIEGRVVAALEIPRVAVREGDQVYRVNDESRLEIRTATVVWREPDRVLVTDGLSAGDRVVVSPLSAPINGMLLRTADSAATAEPEVATGEAADTAGAAQ